MSATSMIQQNLAAALDIFGFHSVELSLIHIIALADLRTITSIIIRYVGWRLERGLGTCLPSVRIRAQSVIRPDERKTFHGRGAGMDRFAR